MIYFQYILCTFINYTKYFLLFTIHFSFFFFFFSIHWLPPECYSNPNLARRSTRADVWALGTTLWEIFSRGTVLPVHNDFEVVKKVYIILIQLYLSSFIYFFTYFLVFFFFYSFIRVENVCEYQKDVQRKFIN